MINLSTPGGFLVTLINWAYLPFFTWWSYYISKKNGFDPIGCAVCGLLFQWITVIVLLIRKPNLDKKP